MLLNLENLPRTIWVEKSGGVPAVGFVDQRLLPDDLALVRTADWREVVDAVKTLAVRGAPAIGVAGAAAVIAERPIPGLADGRVYQVANTRDALIEMAGNYRAAFEPVLQFIKPGMKEADIRDFLFEQMVSRGGSAPWAIVASGPNSGFPHYNGYDRGISEQDVIVLDFGCVYNGMCSDMSRTVFVGDATEEQRYIYDIVDRAQLAAQEAAREGADIPAVDAAARDLLARYDYAETLLNRVGHGIGYMIHEAPDIKQCNHRKLERGMAFSIEPGVYLANRFGMRIENIVVINENGETEPLNKARRDLIVIR